MYREASVGRQEGQRRRGRPRQLGLGLISAIFLIVVVSVLVAAILRMVRTSGEAFAQDVVSQQAFLAAESGAQLGLNRIFAPQGVGACADWTWDLSLLGLPHCEARVACRVEIVQAVPHYTLESDGRCGTGQQIAERRVLVRAVP